MPLPRSIDPERLRHRTPFHRYFRYPLSRDDFQPMCRGRRILGYAAAKPLYGKLTAEGRVDRSGGFDGRIAVLFVPSSINRGTPPRLLFARIPPRCITRPDGRRNWRFIRAAARSAVMKHLADERRQD